MMSSTHALSTFLLPLDTDHSHAEAVALMRCLAEILDERIDKISLLYVTGGSYLSEHMANIDSRAAQVISTDLFKRLRREHLEKEIMPVMENTRTQLKETGIQAAIDIQVEDGDPAERIVALANTGRYSSLILERHDQGLIRKGLGDTVAAILHRQVLPTIYLTGIRPLSCPPACCLVALDERKNSWSALERAAVLAAACGDSLNRIILVSVLDIAAYSARLADGRVEAPVDNALLDRAEGLLLAQGIAKERIVKRLLHGDPAEVLISEIHSHGAEMVFMGRRDRGKFKELFMGSVSTRLIEQCFEQCIVMIGD